MKQFWKDLWFAVFLGLVLPGVILSAAASYTDSSPDSDPVSVPAAALSETMPEGTALPVLVRAGEEVQEEDLDAYLVGVVLGEMPTDFAPEALKAQSVAARTYAWKAYITGGKHHDGSVCTQSGCCQAYIDPRQYLEQGGSLEGLAKVRQTVAATSGLVLSYQGELIEATYFSCSGGQTEDAVAVWGTDYPYLQSVESPGEEDAVHYEDVLTYSLQQFQDALGIVLPDPPEQWFSQVEYTDGGGIASVNIGGQSYTGTQLRSLLGLPSTRFSIQVSSDTVAITTNGYGHRVGMSQYGADAMAVSGSSFQEILAHYYPGTTLCSALEFLPETPEVSSDTEAAGPTCQWPK